MTDSVQPHAVQIKIDAKEALVARSDDVRQRIVDRLVEDELQRRTKILSIKLDERESLDKEIKKIKIKVIGHDEAGNELRQWQGNDFKERQKLLEKLEKLDRLINAVFESPSAETYDKLEKAKV